MSIQSEVIFLLTVRCARIPLKKTVTGGHVPRVYQDVPKRWSYALGVITSSRFVGGAPNVSSTGFWSLSEMLRSQH